MMAISRNSLNNQVLSLIKRKESEHDCLILLSQENDQAFMDVLFRDGKIYQEVLLGKPTSDSICINIMKWFRGR